MSAVVLRSVEDVASQGLRDLCACWEDMQNTRIALAQRGADPKFVDAARKIEDSFGRQIKKALAAHPLGPWLAAHPGVGGVHTARIIAMIGAPWRFPGQPCTNGHYIPTRPDTAAESEARCGTGEGCPVETRDGPCDGALLGPRPGTGTRSLWHYLGLHVVDGRTPQRAKGKQADWNGRGRTAVLMPGGIAEQIVRLRVEPWRSIYDTQKERLTRERGAERRSESGVAGPGAPTTYEADAMPEGERSHGLGTEGAGCTRALEQEAGALRPFQIDALARKIAAKAFIADLLSMWKSLTGADVPAERGVDRGPGQADKHEEAAT